MTDAAQTLLSINAAGSDLFAGVHNFTFFCFSVCESRVRLPVQLSVSET